MMGEPNKRDRKVARDLMMGGWNGDYSRQEHAIAQAIADARAEAIEEAARVAEGTAGPFPKGEIPVADGSATMDVVIAMKHGLGGGRDAIAAAIRALIDAPESMARTMQGLRR